MGRSWWTKSHPGRRIAFLVGCAALAAAAVVALGRLQTLWEDPSPYLHDTLAQTICSQSGKNCWQVFGGSWQRTDGTLVNSSDDRGAKIMNGSSRWRDYVVEADVQLLGESGDAGIIVRSSKEDVGVDAYEGYFAGIRNIDDTLILGRSNYGWQRLRKVPTRSPLKTNTWYHLKFLVYQCWLAATLTNELGEETSASFREEHCYASGRFGLKSYYIPSAWRNVLVYPSSQGLLVAMLQKDPAAGRATVPDPQDSSDAWNDTRLLEPMRRATSARRSGADAESISRLILLDPNVQQQVVIRGVVTMIQPELFVQDATGAVSVRNYQSDVPLRIGNAVEVTGLVNRGDYSVSLEKARVRSMWSHATVLPVSVSATQAAAGDYDKRFIQTDARLLGIRKEDGNRFVLTMQDGQEEFVAVAYDNGLNKTFEQLQPGSRLRLSGICVVEGPSVTGAAAFALLMRSSEDVTTLQPPPWWNWTHITELIVLVVLLSCAIQYAFHSIQRSRTHAVIEERQRLAMAMHDSLAQSFAGIGFRLEALTAGTAKGSLLRSQLESTIDMLRYGHKEARRNIAAISPGNVENLGLFAALQNAARAIVQDGAIAVESSVSGEPRPIPLKVEDVLLRIGQEAIVNAVRHAQPSTIGIRLVFGARFVRLSIRDDGKGFLSGKDGQGYGIAGMQERARAIRASLRVASTHGHGTIVAVRVSLSRRVWDKVSWHWFSRLFLRQSR